MNAPRVALFGKLPRHGDFVRRNVGPEADVWDAWLSEHLERGRDTFGVGFEAVHAGAPPWCFITQLGAVEGWNAGALCPSIDLPGRRFFLVLMGFGLPPEAPLTAVAEAMETQIYRALEQDLKADDILMRACEVLDHCLETEAGETEGAREAWWRLGDEPRLPEPPANLFAPLTARATAGALP